MDNELKQRQCVGINLGTARLPETDKLMSELVQLRMKDRISDAVLFHSYEPCLAYGARDLNQKDLRKPPEYFQSLGIQIYKAIRGGGLTYYWPDQLVCYPIFKLNKDEQNISEFMFRLEEVGLRTLADLGIDAYRRRDSAAQIGLWVDGDKVASMGIHVSRNVTSYGFAVNLAGDSSPADHIRPCGLEGVRLVTVESIIGKKPARGHVMELIITHIKDIFSRNIMVTNKIKIEPMDHMNNRIKSLQTV